MNSMTLYLPPPVVVSKALLEHSKPVHLHIVEGCFHDVTVKQSGRNRDHVVLKA